MAEFNPLNFIANHAGMNLADAIKEAYEQGKMDAQPKTGKWVYIDDGYADYYKCDRCGKISVVVTNYCPNCGVNMRGEQDGFN